MDKKKIITDIDIDNLMSDWLERDGETFTHIRKKGRLGWEKQLEAGDALSDYFLPSDITKHEVIKRAYSLANDLIVIMDPPKKVHIKLTDGGSSRTDSAVVYVNTEVFDAKGMDLGEQIDIFCGLAIHEGCHLCYTNFDACSTIEKKVIHDIFNVIEDERIETLCGDLKPGLAGFLAKTKYYYFDQYFIDVIAPHKAELESKMNDFEKLFNLLLYIIRYPKYLNEETIVKYARFLLEIKKVLLPFPRTTKQSIDAAVRIFNIIKSLYVEEEKKSRKERDKALDDLEKEMDGIEKSEGGSGSGDDDEKAKGGSSSSTEEKEEKKSTAERMSDALDKSDDTEDTRSDTEKRIDERAAERKMEEDASHTEEKMESHSVITEPRKDGSYMKVSEDLSKAHGLGAADIEGEVSFGSSANVIFMKEQDNKGRYMESYSNIRQYIPSIHRILKGHCRDYKLVLRSMRSGVLDTNKLAEAIQGVPTVYMREGEVYTDKITAVILIDESGSMAWGGRINSARDTAVLLNESMKNIPDIELFIYGHSADEHCCGTTELRVYRDKNYHPAYALGSVDAHHENRDGTAILETAKAVRKQTNNPVVMFVLSDGAPAAYGYSGKAAMREVRSKVKQAEKLGFSIVQVCIDASYDPKQMFDHYVILDNMPKLAIDLGKVLKKAVMDGAKVHTRM